MTLLLGAKAPNSNIQTETRQMIKRQVSEWFTFIDSVLDYHRSNFVFREAKPDALVVHKAGLKLAIRTCNQIHFVVADPDFNEPEMLSRLKIRIQQLQDAFDTFNDLDLPDDKAERILADIFPE